MNNSGAGGNMIMTNSSMSTMAAMAGGGLVVSSAVNKPLTNTTNIMAPGQHHPGTHNVSQVSFFLIKKFKVPNRFILINVFNYNRKFIIYCDKRVFV